MKVRIEAGRIGKFSRVWIDDLEVTNIVSHLVLTLSTREVTTLEMRIVPEIVEVEAVDIDPDVNRRVLLQIRSVHEESQEAGEGEDGAEDEEQDGQGEPVG